MIPGSLLKRVQAVVTEVRARGALKITSRD
jgi:hypothetical protein